MLVRWKTQRRSRLVVAALAMLLIMSGCAGPRRPLAVGIKELPSDVLLAARKAANGLPNGIEIDSPIAPGIIPSVAPVVPTFSGVPPEQAGPFVPPAPRVVVQRGATCPDARPDAVAQPAPDNILIAPDAVTRLYRNDGVFDVTGPRTQGQGAYPAESYRTVQDVDARPERGDQRGFHFTVADDLMIGGRNSTRFYVNGAGLHMVSVTTVTPQGTESVFTPASPTALVILPLPAKAGTVRSNQVIQEPGTTRILEYSTNTVGKVKLDACGVLVEAWEVKLSGRFTDPSKNTDVTFTTTYNIATQFGGLILADAVEAGCVAAATPRAEVCANTVNGNTVHLAKRGVADLDVGVVPTVSAPTMPEPKVGSASAVVAGFAGGNAPYTCRVDYGDGSPSMVGTLGDQSNTCSGPPQTFNRGKYVVTVEVTDSDGVTGGASLLLDLSTAPLPKPPAPPPTGTVFFDDALGDGPADYLDLFRGELTCSAGMIKVKVMLSELDPAAPPPGRSDQVFRTIFERENGQVFFVDAAWITQANATAVNWFDGTFAPDGTPLLQHQISGRTINGPWGTAEADLPLVNVGITGATERFKKVTTQALTYPFYAYHANNRNPTPTPNPGHIIRDVAAPVVVNYTNGECTVG